MEVTATTGIPGWILVAAAIVVVLNLVATARILRAAAFSPSQQLVQLMLTWLVPVMGAAVCLAFAHSQAIGDAREHQRLDPYYGDGSAIGGDSGDGGSVFGDGGCGGDFGGGCGGGD
ncbi:hypothetical protein [Marilutibacter maris]|uniref:hypothetical protein n=1 Tax=Marilutibacter maris TaxID=1605891 RepID=UPI000DAA630F|nr:hypothetical protein [Lysobacter maris]